MHLDKLVFCRLALVVAIFVLLINAAFLRRDYQDSWILEGLEVSFVSFLLLYVMVFFSEKKTSSMIALAAVGRIVFLLVPNLKYVWFQGVWIDQHQQYALASHVVDQSHVLHGIEAYAVNVYGGTPFIHLALSVFSMGLNIPVVEAIKFLPVLLSPLYPLLTYAIMVRIKLPFKTNALRYALFISSIPLGTAQSLVTGQMFGGLVVLLVLFCFAALLYRNDRKYYSLLAVFMFVLGATHSSSSLLFAASLLAITLAQKIDYFRIKSYETSSIVLLTLVLCVSWLSFPARFTLEGILTVFRLRVPSGITPRSGAVPDRFLELVSTDVFSGVQTILVQHGANVLLLLLTLAGLVVLLRSWRKIEGTTKFFFMFVVSLVGFMGIGFLFKVGAERPLYLIGLMFPIFSALFILYLDSRKVKWISATVFSIMLFFATLQLYPCQPLVPSADVLFSDLSADEPLFYVTQVNSIYQREMIFFASNYVMNGRIASDRITRTQIAGFAGFDYWVSHVIEYYPIDKNQSERQYDFFLIHLPGISGRFQEPVEIRTRGLILSTIYNSSVIYTNGESYILADN